ncbi:MAG TPA: hypothetical protein VI704_00520 [Bacteroidota bacterium]|nr:hypothetical protein [Bacteroidota bacterium]
MAVQRDGWAKRNNDHGPSLFKSLVIYHQSDSTARKTPQRRTLRWMWKDTMESVFPMLRARGLGACSTSPYYTVFGFPSDDSEVEHKPK